MPGFGSLRRPVAAALWLAVALLGLLAVTTFAGLRAGFLLNIAQTLVPLALLGGVGSSGSRPASGDGPWRR